MPTFTELPESAKMLTPASLHEWLPSRPVLSSFEDGWKDIVLQRFRHPQARSMCRSCVTTSSLITSWGQS